jgi:hypothetical protein
MTIYKCIDTDIPWQNPNDAPSYSIWVSILTYGQHAGLGRPRFDIEPKIRGLLKDDAIVWALGKAHIITSNEDWKIKNTDIEGDKDHYLIRLEDKLGATYLIEIHQDDAL